MPMVRLAVFLPFQVTGMRQQVSAAADTSPNPGSAKLRREIIVNREVYKWLQKQHLVFI